MRPGRGDRGFTLIELAVVMLLIVIVLGMVGINWGVDSRSAVRDEARRLALLLQLAQQDAILRGQILAVSFEPNRYYFARLDQEGVFQPLTRDDVLRPRSLPRGVTISTVTIDGSRAQAGARLLFLPTGDLPKFSVTLSQGRARWDVDGDLTGAIAPRAGGS